jgi:hypothetical protein
VGGVETTFDYNVVGALSNVGYRFRSQQARLLSITQQEQWALLSLRDNINDYLAQVAAITGRAPQVYVEDAVLGNFDYTGTWEISDIALTRDGGTQFLLKIIGNDSPTFHGRKEFPDDNTSQLVYQYRTRMDYAVYDVTKIDGVTKNVLLSTRRQQLDASGYNTFNISELAKGYVSATGGVALQVVAISTDYFGNTDTVTTDPCLLVSARVPEVNYGLYTLFNPETGGMVLPTTGRRLLYGADTVYPFYANFITNTMLGEGSIVQLRVDLYHASTLVDTVFTTVPTLQGLNTVDLSEYPAVVSAILSRKPTSIRLSAGYFAATVGEFTDEFTAEFTINTQGAIHQSGYYAVECRNYTLDNRRDFYFSYQNGIGGLSTHLSREYRRMGRPEIVALRNADTISNSVARETEYVELTFRHAGLYGLKFLLGYDIENVLKYDGIYESQTIERIGADGSRVAWIVQQADYDISNGTLYKDITFTIYRPVGMVVANQNFQ